MASSNLSLSSTRECERLTCNDRTRPTFHCEQCASDYCDECWKIQPQHSPGKYDKGQQHEGIDLRKKKRLEAIFNAHISREEQEALHQKDANTTWFAVVRDSTEHPVFQDSDRYPRLMQECLSAGIPVRYPQLVSFIGQTGDGKSTVIKMLIDGQEMERHPDAPPKAPSPVVGSANDNLPTSGDVHLYAEPGTMFTSQPILYADCEGLQGGESPPGAALSKTTAQDPGGVSSRKTTRPAGLLERLGKAHFKGKIREIKWADTPEKRKREYAVTELYPRLLYTFSDVVVFVLRNVRAFEFVLNKLLSWASACLEKSLNQPALPHAIIALNFTDLSIDESQWDPQSATDKLMADFESVVNRVDKFRELAGHWISLGRPIRSIKDLLHCYYSSVTVVKIPVKGRYGKMMEQVGKLRNEIVSRCKDAHDTKKEARMLSNSDDLQIYLIAAFDHFSRKLDAPFNFVEVAFKNHPIPRNFSGNMLQLAIALKNHPDINLTGKRMFEELGYMFASCIRLDIARQRLLGNPEQLLEDYYLLSCDKTLERFGNQHWPCSFGNHKGHCVLMRPGHVKGHQDVNGKVIDGGSYQSNFWPDKFVSKWHEILKQDLEQINTELQNRKRIEGKDEEPLAAVLHQSNTVQFYSDLGPASHYISHSACFSCLVRELPEHPLPCGHILCTRCVDSYGTKNASGQITLEECPLHPSEPKWPEPWQIRVKPSLAGVRILTLDGGGMRGIVELEILRALQHELPNGIPVQAFFDLVVGTSTGGIIALGLCAKNWPVSECIARFKSLCQQAFTPREFSKTPLETLALLNHGSLYRTTPLTSALKSSLSDDKLFGGTHRHQTVHTKVAVTSTTQTGQRPVILANYNRRQYPGVRPDYLFERPDTPINELGLWEAARATSAAPGFFKSFEHQSTGKGYLDGALYYNNPVRVANIERKLIWPDTINSPPDLFLSIGTGFNETIRLASETATKPLGSLPRSPAPLQLIETQKRKKILQVPRILKLFKIMKDRMDNLINTELSWINFTTDIFTPDQDVRSRYQRFNLDLGFEPPKMDKVDQLSVLEEQAHERLKEQGNRHKIRQIAFRLVASSFYFEKSMVPTKHGEIGCTGKILCRFPPGSEEIRHLGRYLQYKTTAFFQPYFLIEGPGSKPTQRNLDISQNIITQMINNAEFSLNEIYISVVGEQVATSIEIALTANHKYSISGFPRALMLEPPVRPHSPSPPENAESSTPRSPETAFLQRRQRQRREMSISANTSMGTNSPLRLSPIPLLAPISGQLPRRSRDSDLSLNDLSHSSSGRSASPTLLPVSQNGGSYLPLLLAQTHDPYTTSGTEVTGGAIPPHNYLITAPRTEAFDSQVQTENGALAIGDADDLYMPASFNWQMIDETDDGSNGATWRNND